MTPISTADLAEALAALDPADRALLELSFRAGMPADEVADVLGSPETSVVDRREAALEALADELGVEPGGRGLEAALASEEPWRGGAAAPAAGPDEPLRRRRLGSLRRRLILLGLAALALGIAAGILIASSSDDSDDASNDGDESSRAAERSAANDGAAPSPPRPKRELGPAVELEQQIQGIGGKVTARLVRSGGRVRLALRARELPKPKGSYEIWLLDAPKRAVSLARFKTEEFELDAPLPPDFAGYQQLDITVEPDDANKDHSGLSAFRTDIKNLAIR